LPGFSGFDCGVRLCCFFIFVVTDARMQTRVRAPNANKSESTECGYLSIPVANYIRAMG
jgi:hypothetical protein